MEGASLINTKSGHRTYKSYSIIVFLSIASNNFIYTPEQQIPQVNAYKSIPKQPFDFEESAPKPS